MSKYTTEIRYICETYAGLDESKGFDDIDDIINNSYQKVFNFSYPIFSEEYKPVLEKKILKNFYTREICEETVGLWKLRLCNRLNQIMPYYNQLYLSELEAKNINLLDNTNVTIDHNIKRDGSSTINDTSTTSNTSNVDNTNSTSGNDQTINLFSATPQGALSEADLFISDTGATYLTEASKNKKSDTRTTTDNTDTTTNGSYSSNGSSTFESEDDFIQHIVGKQGGISNAQAIAEARKTFLNIDMMILDDLRTLFFGLW